MKIEKKGFTLVEILAVIVVLTVLSSIVLPSAFNMIRNARQKSYDTLINDIEENGNLYVAQHRKDVETSLLSLNYYTFTLNDLKLEGLLKTPVIDSRTSEAISLNKKLIVTRKSDDTLSICFEDRGCYIPTLLYNKLTANVVTGDTQGLHQDVTNNFYYFAGANPKNWIVYNNLLWRIVKINSDGTIKIVYEGKKKNNWTVENGKTTIMQYDYSYNDYNQNVNIKTYLQNWYNSNITDENKAKVATRNWCIGKTAYSESGVTKATFLSNECSQTLSLSIGLISASDYLYASTDAECLGSNSITCGNKNYLNKSDYDYWSITSDSVGSNIWTLKNGVAATSFGEEQGVRPVVNLISGILTEKGDGTFDHPFEVKKELNADTVKPVITITGSNPAFVVQGDAYGDLGATATDNVDGNLTANIIAISNVDTNIIGTYNVTYVVLDNSGNMQRVSREVKVIDQYYSVNKGVNKPQLATGMTPIKWNGSAWIDTNEGDIDWYNYTTTDKKWANARTADGSMWVWIPRYVYKISSGWHTTSPVVEIQFSMSFDDTRAGTVTLDTSMGSPASNNKWATEPAFTFGNTELAGFWMSKFEASSSNPDPEYQGGGENIALKVKSVPSVSAWRNISLDNSYIVSRLMEKDNYYGWGTSGKGIDTHLIKNSEWGAVAYLSQSVYGKNAPVWNNPNLESTTGCAGATAHTESTWGTEACSYLYNTANGLQASTTGNIYGVYDMVGGAEERTAAYVKNAAADQTEYDSWSGSFSLPILEKTSAKYKDVYDLGSPDSITNNYPLAINKRGDAVYETTAVTATTWGNGSMMPSTDTPWFSRGGTIDESEADVYFFSYQAASGGSFISSNDGWWSLTGFRSTIVVSKFASLDEDNTRPLIRMLGDSPKSITLGAAYTDAGAQAYDEKDGMITDNIVTTGSVNPNVAGTYYINYNVKDSDGNSAAQATRTVIVNP